MRIVFAVLLAGVGISTVLLFVNRLAVAGVLGAGLGVGLIAWASRTGNKRFAAESTEQSVDTPRPATVPPDGHIRFTLVVEGLEPARVAQVWSDLCRPDRVPTDELRQLFRNFTVTEGQRFRFRSGDPKTTAELLTSVLGTATGVPVRTRVEPAAERTPVWS